MNIEARAGKARACGLDLSPAVPTLKLVKIPMAGKLDSLHLAVATALTLYQVRSGALNV